jgi:hypothetical protein
LVEGCGGLATQSKPAASSDFARLGRSAPSALQFAVLRLMMVLRQDPAIDAAAPACERHGVIFPPFGSTSIIAALSRPNADWNFFFLPFAYAERSFFASLTMCLTIAFFSFGLGTLRITIVRLLLRNNSATV